MDEEGIKPEDKFIGNYMVLKTIGADAFKKRYLSEDMRSNKEVWIDEYAKQTLSEQEYQNILQTAREVKKINIASIPHIYDVIEEHDHIFIIMDIPKGKVLRPLMRYHEKTVHVIALRLTQTLLTLHRINIGIHELLPEQIHMNSANEMQLVFGREMIHSADQNTHLTEIKSLGTVLYFLILGEFPTDSENAEERLRTYCQDPMADVIIRMLSDDEAEKFYRLEQILPFLEEKRDIGADPILLADSVSTPIMHKIFRVAIIVLVAVFLYTTMYQPKSFALEEISTFDTVRFHMLGYLGVEEAQQALGEIYEKGYGVNQNYDESIQWYKRAAQNGNVYSQLSLGHMYDEGIGVAADKKQALYWFTLAAANGDENAKYSVEMIGQKPGVDGKHTDRKSDAVIQPEIANKSIEDSNSHQTPRHYFHTYWVHSGSSNNIRKSDQFGGIYGCYEEGLKNPLELVSFNHEVRSIAVDGDGNLYWADITTGQIIKADPNGQNSRVIVSRLFHPMGIAIDKRRKLLFWSDRQKNAKGYSGGVGRSDLEGNGVQYIVINDLFSGGKLKVDENEAKLYIPNIAGKKIVRVDEDGHNMIGLVFAIKPEGFDIDPQRRKMYWTDDMNSGIYESDYDGRNKRLVYTYYTTDENFEILMFSPKDQRVYFGRLGPGSQSIGYSSIYDEHSYRIQEYVTNFKIHDIIRN